MSLVDPREIQKEVERILAEHCPYLSSVPLQVVVLDRKEIVVCSRGAGKNPEAWKNNRGVKEARDIAERALRQHTDLGEVNGNSSVGIFKDDFAIGISGKILVYDEGALRQLIGDLANIYSN